MITTRITIAVSNIISCIEKDQRADKWDQKMTKTKNHLPSSYQRPYWTKKKLNKKRTSSLSQDTNAIWNIVVKTITLMKTLKMYWKIKGYQNIKGTRNRKNFTHHTSYQRNQSNQSNQRNQSNQSYQIQWKMIQDYIK